MNLPAEYGGGNASILVCMTCGRPVEVRASEKSTSLAPAVEAMLSEYTEASDRGATEAELMQVLTRRQFEAGVVYGSILTARKLVETVTFKGRLRRLRALWPFNSEESRQEAHDLLLIGDQHHGS
jgi:hypothetical protein